MPWLNKVHRCQLPDIENKWKVGEGSRWQCGDVGTDVCGQVWEVIEDTDGTFHWIEVDPE